MPELPLKDAILYPRATLQWLDQAITSGEAILKQEPTFNDIPRNIEYVMGKQLGDRPKTLSTIVDNRTKQVVLETVSGLTDIHPLFGFSSKNPFFQDQVVILSDLIRAWWTNQFADLHLADVIRYSMAAGTGYCEVNWDSTLQGGQGDLIFTPVDPRDVIPIGPRFDFSIQSWDGVIIRSMETLDTLTKRYGVSAAGLQADQGGSWLSRLWSSTSVKVETPSNIFDATKQSNRGHNMPNRVSSKQLFKVYLKDSRIWDGGAPIVMGDPKTSWAYTVYPIGFVKPNGEKATEAEAQVYPRGRLIVATKDRVLYDGPNPYWHGMFPIAKLSLEPWPWSIMGGSLVSSLRCLQDAANELINGYWDHIKKVLRPALIADKRAMPSSVWNRIDTRIAGQKLQQNPTAGKGVEYVPEGALPGDVFEFLQFILSEIDKQSGTTNMQALMSLNQAPSADSIEKMQDALSPVLRMKARLLEVFLRELGEMIKSGIFQFYTVARRVAILGDAGVSLREFDFDPGSLVPAMHDKEPGYHPSLDYLLPTAQRAKVHMANFTFEIEPASLLSINSLPRKLTYLQMYKIGLVDPYSVGEVMEIPNYGMPPSDVKTVVDKILYAQKVGLMPPSSPPVGAPPGFSAPPQVSQRADGQGGERTVTTTSQ